MSREVEDLNRRLLRARDAMDRTYAEPLDVRAVAAVAHLSEAHFIRSFRAVFGETPHRYLQRRRVERSMFLLRETDRSVTDVCFDVGFTSLAKKAAQKPAKSRGFTAAEKAAMKETIGDQKAAARGLKGESALLAKIAAMKEPDRGMAKRIHAIVKANAPSLSARTYYGMPAYAKGDKVVLFFKDAHKFKERYATLGFNDTANLDEGAMWPTSFALKELTGAEEARIGALVKKAVR